MTVKLFNRIILILFGSAIILLVIGPIAFQYINNISYLNKYPLLQKEWELRNITSYSMEVNYFAGPTCIETYKIKVSDNRIIEREIINSMWDKNNPEKYCYKDDVTIVGMYTFAKQLIQKYDPINYHIDITIDREYGYISKIFWGCGQGLLGSAIGDCTYSYRFENFIILN